MKITFTCKCGASGEGKGQWDTQGDGMMTGDILEVEETPGEWEGGDPNCVHEDAEISADDPFEDEN